MCGPQRRRREVETGDAAGTEAGQTDGVGADVALQVDHIEAVETTEPG